MFFCAGGCFYIAVMVLIFTFFMDLFENQYLTIGKIKPMMVHR